jgi:hypothetical protein
MATSHMTEKLKSFAAKMAKKHGNNFTMFRSMSLLQRTSKQQTDYGMVHLIG